MKQNDSESKKTRREFFRGVARGCALTGLAAVAAVLAARGLSLGSGSGDCTGRGLCNRCDALSGCKLPQAMIARGGERKGPR